MEDINNIKCHDNVIIGNFCDTGVTENEHHNIIIGEGCKVIEGHDNIVIGKGHTVEGSNNIVISMIPQIVNGHGVLIIDDKASEKHTVEDIVGIIHESFGLFHQFCKKLNENKE